MKALVICSQYPPLSSAESAHSMLLCEELAAQGVDVDLLTSKLTPGFPEPRGFRIHPIMKTWGWGQFPTLLFTIRRLQPDVVLLIYIDWIYECHPMITFAPAALSFFLPNTAFVTQFENVSGLTGTCLPNNFKSQLAKIFFSLFAGRAGLHATYGTLLRDSKGLIALSDRHAEAFNRAQPGICHKIEVIPAPPLMRFATGGESGSARHRGRDMLGLSDKEIVLAYFGYIYWMKGLETLLTAFGTLPCNTKLVIIGGSNDAGYLEKLRTLSRSAGGAERVVWVGHCKPEEELASLYLYAADICVLPFNDGVRLNNSSFAVAASHGLPIVTTRGETIESPFLDGENVRLCPAKDPDALAAAITGLIYSPKTRGHLADGARKLAGSHFSWNRVIESTLRVLHRAAHK